MGTDAVDNEPAPRPEEQQPRKKRPWAWIVVCGVLAAAVIGLLVWGLGQRSDANDAKSKASAQQQAASKATEANAETQQQYENVNGQLNSANENLDQIEQDLDDAEAKANDAEAAAKQASSESEKVKAEADAAKADAEKAGACMRGTVEALGAAFSSGGLQAAVDEMQKLSGRCGSGGSS